MQISALGAGQLQRLYRAASTATSVTLSFRDSVVLPKNENVEEAYIGYLPASELLKIISLYNEDDEIYDINKTIFFDNIRDYNPDSKINKEIESSLDKHEQTDFVYRNNGVTVVSRSIDRTGNNFSIEDFQIVNGCQTSNVIFHNRDKIEDVYVPFRLIGTKDEDFIVSIISGTNKQNPVKPEQFWSLLPFMKNLEEFSRNTPSTKKIFLERRENQYRGASIERSRIVQMQPFLKAVTASLLGAPHRAARNYKAEIQENIDELFSENHDVRPAYAVAYLHYRLEFLWRNQKIDSSLKLFRYYFIDAMTRMIIGNKRFSSLNAKQKTKFSEELIKFASDETGLIKKIKSIQSIIDRQIKSSTVTNVREKLRDMIRSEAFFTGVRKKYIPNKATI